ncbi:MAG: DUF4136 domain-containing protein [Steroidobacteraceae bacterium]
MSTKSGFAKAALVALLVVIAGCATGPRIRSQSAPGGNVANFRTYGYFEKLGTDTSSYASVLSLNLKAATSREMESRGYRLATSNPDLLLNFSLAQVEKIDGRSGPTFGLGFGRGWGSWRGSYGWGAGINDVDIRSTTEGTLTIDVVDRAKNEIVWAGSAVAPITSKVLDDPKAAIDATVPKIFAKYPGRAAP